jgi:hypothetical protein
MHLFFNELKNDFLLIIVTDWREYINSVILKISSITLTKWPFFICMNFYFWKTQTKLVYTILIKITHLFLNFTLCGYHTVLLPFGDSDSTKKRMVWIEVPNQKHWKRWWAHMSRNNSEKYLKNNKWKRKTCSLSVLSIKIGEC